MLFISYGHMGGFEVMVFGSSYADARQEKTGDGAARFARIVVSTSSTIGFRGISTDISLFISNHRKELSVLFRSVAVAGSMDVRIGLP